VFSVVTFTLKRGLVFKWNTDKLYRQHDGNYLGCLEFLAKYDPFLSKYIWIHENTSRGNVLYLSLIHFLTNDKLIKNEIEIKATNLVQVYPLD
jgi:hypothetical protein